jgi:hypothetical protein
MRERSGALTVKVSISISDQWAACARKQVEVGRFAFTLPGYEARKAGFFEMLYA